MWRRKIPTDLRRRRAAISGVFKRGALAKELEDKTFAMKAGDVTEVIRTKQGYVILKVTATRRAGIPAHEGSCASSYRMRSITRSCSLRFAPT